MAFKLIESAQDRWRAVNAPHIVGGLTQQAGGAPARASGSSAMSSHSRAPRVMTLSSLGGAPSTVMPGTRPGKPGSLWPPPHDRATPQVTLSPAPGLALPRRSYGKPRRKPEANWADDSAMASLAGLAPSPSPDSGHTQLDCRSMAEGPGHNLSTFPGVGAGQAEDQP